MRDRTSVLCSLALAGLVLASGCRKHEPGTYDTPEAAIQAAHNLIGPQEDSAIDAVFGPGAADLFRSGDPAADRRGADRAKELIAEKVAFEDIDERTKVALLGNKAWPFPIPLVHDGKVWRWDLAAGREELLNRRIGYNELSTLASLHAFVDAQFEYVAARRGGNPVAFAKRFISTEGQQDGLYWPTAEGEPESPLGDLLAAATVEASEPGEPYNGYHYRILTAQGKSAPGGERSYLDKDGRLTRGFAAIAWPAKHGNSGVMTFIVNQRDIVFQKDLGADTAQAVTAIQAFDPDQSWEPTSEALEEDEEEEPLSAAPATSGS